MKNVKSVFFDTSPRFHYKLYQKPLIFDTQQILRLLINTDSECCILEAKYLKLESIEREPVIKIPVAAHPVSFLWLPVVCDVRTKIRDSKELAWLMDMKAFRLFTFSLNSIF